jgi:hypothetical protein
MSAMIFSLSLLIDRANTIGIAAKITLVPILKYVKNSLYHQSSTTFLIMKVANSSANQYAIDNKTKISITLFEFVWLIEF